MTNKVLVAAVGAAVLALSTEAFARAPAPLVPTALVEDVKSTPPISSSWTMSAPAR